MSYTTDGIRNIALAGHASAGKTTLFEALLHAGGAIQTAGSIERGTTVSDHDPMEKERRHSMDASIASIDVGDVHVNLIDTPGYPDFRGPTISALSAVETCAIVVDAVIGIAHTTRRLMERAKARNLCRILIVNKIDHEGIDLEGITESLRDEFGSECLPINLPAKGREGVVDCFFEPGGATDFSSVAAAHQQIIDQIVEINETFMGHYLDDGESGLSGQELHDAFEQCLREGHLVPICLRVRAQRCRREGIARSGNETPTESDVKAIRRRSSRAAARTHNRFWPKPIRRNTSSRTCSRSSTIRSSASCPCSASTRARCARTRSCSSTTARSRSRSAICSSSRARITSRSSRRFRATSRRSRRSRKSTSTRCCTIRTTKTRSTCKPIDFPVPMFGLAVEPAHKGQEQKLSSALAPARRGRPVLPRRAQQGTQRDDHPRPLGPAPEADARAHEGALWRRGDVAAAAHRVSRNDRRESRRPLIATRSRPAAPASSARCTCASNRCRAAAASSSSTRSRAARFRASSFPRSRKACARCSNTARSPAISCRTCA